MSIVVVSFVGAAQAPHAAQAPKGSNHTPKRDAASEADWKSVEQALGASGDMQPGGVFRIAMPRTDLKVKVQRSKTPRDSSTCISGRTTTPRSRREGCAPRST